MSNRRRSTDRPNVSLRSCVILCLAALAYLSIFLYNLFDLTLS